MLIKETDSFKKGMEKVVFWVLAEVYPIIIGVWWGANVHPTSGKMCKLAWRVPESHSYEVI